MAPRGSRSTPRPGRCTADGSGCHRAPGPGGPALRRPQTSRRLRRSCQSRSGRLAVWASRVGTGVGGLWSDDARAGHTREAPLSLDATPHPPKVVKDGVCGVVVRQRHHRGEHPLQRGIVGGRGLMRGVDRAEGLREALWWGRVPGLEAGALAWGSASRDGFGPTLPSPGGGMSLQPLEETRFAVQPPLHLCAGPCLDNEGLDGHLGTG